MPVLRLRGGAGGDGVDEQDGDQDDAQDDDQEDEGKE